MLVVLLIEFCFGLLAVCNIFLWWASVFVKM